MTLAGRRIEIRGTVQGVGFRPWVYRLAHRFGVAGSVRNGPGGVTIEAFGREQVLDQFLAGLSAEAPAASDIVALEWSAIEPAGLPQGFAIAPSDQTGERRPAIPADLATCEACLGEIHDPGDRRYRYAFTNCTSCGPRYSIALDVPYDRAATTMAGFAMCDACRAEYERPSDRRFHAEPIACPRCGPRLRLLDALGQPIACSDPLLEAAALLRDGRIVAIKGIGGYHLACDATSDAAVVRLRARKQRDDKPFAVMVRDLTTASKLALVNAQARELLASVERPIVLVAPRRAYLSPAVAPDAPRLGIMLPYTPLHQLLLEAVQRPLVMTSGNLSGEPIVHRDDEAVARLGRIADALLCHDRDIASPTDDSVGAVVAGHKTVVRRSRGFVPRPLQLPARLREPLLACGAQLKNAFAIGVGNELYFGPHVGDLDNVESFDAFVEAIGRMERFLRVEPRVIAHDLHPDYLSTRHALEREHAGGAALVGVQHHHAHIASVMAEHGLAGPVLGMAFDGSGLGLDGSLWGGEILAASFSGFERLATLRPIALAGGERAIVEVWRLALVALDDAFDGDPPLEALSLFGEVPQGDVALVRRVIASELSKPKAHGAGRWFDVFGALVLGRPRARYEGQIAMALERAADPVERARYPFAIEGGALAELDLRPALRAAVADLLNGGAAGAVAARFHNTLAAGTAELVALSRARTGELPLVLSGGCFQNERLVHELDRLLGPGTFRNERVPAGDGGIALGQAAIAASRIERGEASCV